jgi:hypothetical protein
MNEVEWLAGTDPDAMLDYLEGKVSERRLRLFACACCRRLWRHVKNPTVRGAVEASEAFAEGKIRRRALRQARQQAEAIAMNPPEFEAYAFQAAVACAADRALDAARQVLGSLRRHAGEESAYEAVFNVQEAYATGREEAARVQAELIRTFFGNPFRPVHIDPAWLHANDGAVLKLARVIDEHLQFEELPYLQDALVDAGCDCDILLRACRIPGRSVLAEGMHGRGFWVLDALLGRALR